jgi:hypothetical protein
MKNETLKNILLILGSLVLLITCKKESGNSGAVTAKLTNDAASEKYASVNIDIKSVEIHQVGKSGDDGGWTLLSTNAGVYDLLSLRNNVSVVLAQHPSISTDKITEIRLVLGEHNWLVTKDSAILNLTVPSGEESGLKITTNLTASDKYNLDIELDFDADKSIIQTDAGYTLKPVIHIKRIGFH